jgi:hypothetical protein
MNAILTKVFDYELESLQCEKKIGALGEGFLGPNEPLEWPNVAMKCTFTLAVIKLARRKINQFK